MPDITNLLNTGDSAHRVDIAIVAEGYTAAEREQFLADARSFLENYLGQSNARLNAPFSSYLGFFNANALFFASAQSGTDQPNNNISVDTYFNATQHGSDGRLLYGDGNKVEQEVAKALASNAHELTIVLVNTPVYGGAGGSIAWASAGHSAASELALHETGHSFALLQDEYVDSVTAASFSLFDPGFLNSVHVTDSLNRIPWQDWLGYKDELGVVGTYVGGYYRATGVWRATQNSKMNTLGVPFSAPEKEAFAQKYYALIGDYLTVSSNIPGVYHPVTPNNDLFSYTWNATGKPALIGDGKWFDAVAAGVFTAGGKLNLTTIDNTGLIRKNLVATQQVESVSMTGSAVSITDANYIVAAKDSNAVLQFSDGSNHQIDLNNLQTEQRIYFNGGTGNDVLKVNANLLDSSHFNLNQINSGTVLLANDSGQNWAMHQIDTVQFQDFSVNLVIHANSATISAADLKSLEELYVAYFNRIPEADGLNYWINAYKGGMSLNSIGDAFYASAILFSDLTHYTDKMSNAEFINILYKNALGRVDGADAGGLAYWTGELAKGVSRGAMVHVILGTAHNFKGDKTWGWVADLLDNKAAVANKFAVEWGLNYSTEQANILNGMEIAKLITPFSIAEAIKLIGLTEGQIQFV